jgi:hypothetical protein
VAEVAQQGEKRNEELHFLQYLEQELASMCLEIRYYELRHVALLLLKQAQQGNAKVKEE